MQQLAKESIEENYRVGNYQLCRHRRLNYLAPALTRASIIFLFGLATTLAHDKGLSPLGAVAVTSAFFADKKLDCFQLN